MLFSIWPECSVVCGKWIGIAEKQMILKNEIVGVYVPKWRAFLSVLGDKRTNSEKEVLRPKPAITHPCVQEI